MPGSLALFIFYFLFLVFVFFLVGAFFVVLVNWVPEKKKYNQRAGFCFF